MYDDDYVDYDDYDTHDEWVEENEGYSDEDLSSEEYLEEDIYQHDPVLSKEDMSPQVEWRTIILGKHRYQVTSNGKIRHFGKMATITEGLHKVGTPYRTFPIELDDGTICHKYMHNIVYEAFNGHPPKGWEVRHHGDIVMKGDRIYSNALEDLEIYMII
jgi:hypothetical protein